jgi:hypothetical protein
MSDADSDGSRHQYTTLYLQNTDKARCTKGHENLEISEYRRRCAPPIATVSLGYHFSTL